MFLGNFVRSRKQVDKPVRTVVAGHGHQLYQVALGVIACQRDRGAGDTGFLRITAAVVVDVDINEAPQLGTPRIEIVVLNRALTPRIGHSYGTPRRVQIG